MEGIQVLTDLFVTFFGFGLAILGERVTEWIKKRNDAKELKKIILEELKKVFNDLSAFREEMLEVQPLKIPSWDSALNTGQVSLFDFPTRNKLFYIYNTINEFNSWCLVHTNFYFEKERKNELLITEINKIKKKLLEESDVNISSMIDMLEGSR